MDRRSNNIDPALLGPRRKVDGEPGALSYRASHIDIQGDFVAYTDYGRSCKFQVTEVRRDVASQIAAAELQKSDGLAGGVR